MNEMMRLREVANQLKVSKVTAWRWARKGYLPAVQTESGTIRVYRSDLDNFIKKIGSESIANNNATSEC